MKKIMQVKLGDVMPNPYRNLKSYTLQADRLESLKESINQTGFWANVVARPHGETVEIAYGHHRLQAAIEVLGEDYVHTFPVADLSDYVMLQMMAAENSEAWSNTTAHDNETVAAAREMVNDYLDEYKTWEASEAQAKGPIHGITHEQVSEWFTLEHSYTRAVNQGVGSEVLAHFLSWSRYKVAQSLANLPLDERTKKAIAKQRDEAKKLQKEGQAKLEKAEKMVQEAEDNEAKAKAEAKQKAIEKELARADKLEKQALEKEARDGRLDLKAVELFTVQRHASEFRNTVVSPLFQKMLPVNKQYQFAQQIIKELGDGMTRYNIKSTAEKLLRKQTPKMSHLDPAEKYSTLISSINGASDKMYKSFVDLRDVLMADGVDTIPNMPTNTNEKLQDALTAIVLIYKKFGMEPPKFGASGVTHGYGLPNYTTDEALEDLSVLEGEVING